MMLLQELFNTLSKGRIVKHTKDDYVVEATVNDRLIKIHAQKPSPSGNVWLFWFEEETEDDNGHSKMTMAKTGSGKALEVLSLVKNVLTDFIAEYKPEKIMFEGSKTKKDDRTKLYKKMLERFNKDYSVTTKERDDSTIFVLEIK